MSAVYSPVGGVLAGVSGRKQMGNGPAAALSGSHKGDGGCGVSEKKHSSLRCAEENGRSQMMSPPRKMGQHPEVRTRPGQWSSKQGMALGGRIM